MVQLLVVLSEARSFAKRFLESQTIRDDLMRLVLSKDFALEINL